jgi:hypothetical protein
MIGEFGEGWQGAGGMPAPAETMPGPSNPWATCAGAEGSEPAKPDVPLPDFAVEEGSLRINWSQFGVGVSGLIMALGFALIGLALALAIAAGLVTGGAAWVLGAIVVGILVGAGILAVIGSGSIISSIDPPTPHYAARVVPPPLRKLALHPDMPRELRDLLLHLAEIERLGHAELHITDRARAAAAAKDEKWYDLHMRDLWAVQHLKTHHFAQAGRILAEFAKGHADRLSVATVEVPTSLRDALNPLAGLRKELTEGGLTDSEIEGILFHTRVPSPLQSFLQEQAVLAVKEAKGDPGALLMAAAERMTALDAVEWEAFGRDRTAPR